MTIATGILLACIGAGLFWTASAIFNLSAADNEDDDQ